MVVKCFHKTQCTKLFSKKQTYKASNKINTIEAEKGMNEAQKTLIHTVYTLQLFISELKKFSLEIINNNISEELDNLRWEYNFAKAKESDTLAELYDETLQEIEAGTTEVLTFE